MSRNAGERAVLIHIIMVCGLGALLTFMTSCTRPMQRPTDAATLITVREVINDNGLKYPTRVYVYRDGKYILERVDPTSKSDRPRRDEGRLSPALLAELESLVESGAVSRSSVSAQFDVYPDNSYITPPKAIEDLLNTIIK